MTPACDEMLMILPALLRDHAGREFARQEEGRAEVHRHGGVPVLNRGLQQRVEQGDRRHC